MLRVRQSGPRHTATFFAKLDDDPRPPLLCSKHILWPSRITILVIESVAVWGGPHTCRKLRNHVHFTDLFGCGMIWAGSRIASPPLYILIHYMYLLYLFKIGENNRQYCLLKDYMYRLTNEVYILKIQLRIRK